jgi:hypothetical protein
MRKVHAFDYWTSTTFENERLMTWKLGSAFLRIDADYKEIEGVQTVFKKINEVNEAKISEEVLPVDYLGLLRTEIEKYIRETEKLGKDAVKEVWKCSLCDKKFKSCEFLAKHIIVKHPEIKDRVHLSFILESEIFDGSSLHERPKQNHTFIAER